MKKMLLGLLLTISLNAFTQDIDKKEVKAFLGSWDVEFLDLPEGNIKATLVLELKDKVLNGELKNEMGSTALYNFTVEGKQMKFYYMYGEYELYVTMKLIDKDNMEGTVADMFDIVGKRSVEPSE